MATDALAPETTEYKERSDGEGRRVDDDRTRSFSPAAASAPLIAPSQLLIAARSVKRAPVREGEQGKGAPSPGVAHAFSSCEEKKTHLTLKNSPLPIDPFD